MKKLMLVFLMSIMMIPSLAFAKDNRLYFEEKENKLYYDGKLLDEEVFMKHTDMMPGDSFEDNLVIENGTNTEYTLFFKIENIKQNAKALELLNNISMKIYIDEKLVYDGNIKGNDLSSLGNNLNNSVELGVMKPNSSMNMKVITSLSKDYNSFNNDEKALIDWTFYAQYGEDEPTEIVVVPSTGKDIVKIIPFIAIIIIIIGACLVIYDKKIKN